MQIVIPMAGNSIRFANAGYSIIKPLIVVDGKPMITHVVNLFSKKDNYIFICNKEHLKKYPLEKTLRSTTKNVQIVAINHHSLGPVESILKAQKFIAEDSPTIINYCDFFMDWNYNKFKQKVKNNNISGAIICYSGFHPHLLGDDLYAGVKSDKNNNFIETKEKYSYTINKMDSWQSTGTYYFSSGLLAKKYLHRIKESKLITNGEYYVPWAFNFMHEDKLRVIVYPATYFCQWGTPEHLKEYQYWSAYFKQIKISE